MAKNPANRYQTAGDMRADLIRRSPAGRSLAEPVMPQDERHHRAGRRPPAPRQSRRVARRRGARTAAERAPGVCGRIGAVIACGVLAGAAFDADQALGAATVSGPASVGNDPGRRPTQQPAGRWPGRQTRPGGGPADQKNRVISTTRPPAPARRAVTVTS